MNKLKRPSINRAQKTPVPAESAAEARVTNESVSRHREEMLTRARKFKYPFHRSKHRVALISISLAILSLFLLGLFTSWRLYISKNTGEFTYRVTQIIPFPVAKVDGAYTSYENYLFQLRHNVYWLEQVGTTDLKSPDGQRQVNYFKRLALDKANESTLAQELADQNDISVSKEEVDEVVNRISTSGGDLKTILKQELNLTESEYRRLVKDEILKAKVAKALDDQAPKRAEEALKKLRAGAKFSAVAKEYSNDNETNQLGGEIGVVEKGRANVPSEVSEQIFKLKNNQTSGVISTPTGYYIVKVLEKVDANRAKVAWIHVKFKDMTTLVIERKAEGKVKEYIKLDEVASEQVE